MQQLNSIMIKHLSTFQYSLCNFLATKYNA